MTNAAHPPDLITGMIDTFDAALDLSERTIDAGGKYFRELQNISDGSSAGFIRYWDSRNPLLDRMVLVCLIGGPVKTQLLFLFGRAENTLPHFHGQLVQFPPDACVYNVDLLPRLDPVEHPAYFAEVMHPLSKPYLKAVSKKDNSCAQAPMNPALAAFMSPWGIGSGKTDQAEVDRVTPLLNQYVEHYVQLASSLDYPAPEGLA
ncbi:MAG: hypothetical protein ACR2P6_08225, partial [Gammaproteobacteria bacterium]